MRVRVRKKYEVMQTTYVKIEYGHIDVVEQFSMILDAVAAAHENNDLLARVPFQESEEQQKSPIALADDVALLEMRDGGCGQICVHVDVQRSGS